MRQYENLGGDSGVHGYDIEPDSIRVYFANDRSWYDYTDGRTGARHVARMKQLAEAGRGLHSYINQNVRSMYAGKGKW